MIRKIDGAVSRGICGLLPAEAFTGGRIRPHEKTLSARLHRQRELVATDRGALGKPILLTAENLDDMWTQRTDHLSQNDGEVSFDGNYSSYFLKELVANVEPRSLPIDLGKIGTLVIADGHHRAETHARLAAAGNARCAHVPVCLVDVRELTIGIFGRFLPTVADNIDDLLAKLERYFHVSPNTRPTAPIVDGTWLMTYHGRYYELTWKRRPDSHTASDWMVGTVLKDIFGIDDPTDDPRLEHKAIDVRPDGLLELPDERTLSFCGASVSTDLFFREVGAGRTLPPKSTRFSPRIPSGLIVWKGCPV